MLIETPKIYGQFTEPAFLTGDLFGDLSPAAQNSLRALRAIKEFAAGETIFACPETPSAIYILAHGEAQILLDGETPARAVKTGEILGLTEAVSNLPYEITVKTITESRFEYIRRDAFLDFLRDEPAVCLRLLEIISANLHELYRFFR